LAIDATTFVWAAGAATLLRHTPPALRKQDRTGVLDELRTGAGYVRHHSVLGPVALSGCVAGVGTGIVGSVVIVHVTKSLGYDTGPQGVVYAIGGVGSLFGAALAPKVLARFGLQRTLVIALVATAPAFALMAWAPGPSLIGYAMLVGQQLLADPLGTISLVAFGTLVAGNAPDAMRGRVESTVMVLSTLGIAAGFVVGGALGERQVLGTAWTLFAGGLVTASACVFLTKPSVRTADVRPVTLAAAQDVPS
jgi:MFS family permease